MNLIVENDIDSWKLNLIVWIWYSAVRCKTVEEAMLSTLKHGILCLPYSELGWTETLRGTNQEQWRWLWLVNPKVCIKRFWLEVDNSSSNLSTLPNGYNEDDGIQDIPVSFDETVADAGSKRTWVSQLFMWSLSLSLLYSFVVAYFVILENVQAPWSCSWSQCD